MASIEEERRQSLRAAEEMTRVAPAAGQYSTPLSREQEEKFQRWYQSYANMNGLDPNADAKEHYYDYRGFWRENGPASNAAIEKGHFPDTYKTPGHPTFSIESKYAKMAPGLAGTWNEKGEWVAPPKMDKEEVKMRQRYMESHFNDNVKDSEAGAIGRFQITPIGLKQYKMDTGETGDLRDAAFNEKVRDHLMNRYYNLSFVKEGYPTDEVRTAKALAAYNWGEGSLKNFLAKQKDAGVDIYGSLDWVDNLPQSETRNYIKFIVQNMDANKYKTNADYDTRVKEIRKTR